jgi:hypothetical protein
VLQRARLCVPEHVSVASASLQSCSLAMHSIAATTCEEVFDTNQTLVPNPVLCLCSLDAHWQLGGADAPDVELEAWVEPPRPHTDAEAEADFIQQNRVFEYTPHGGALRPGEVCTVRPAPAAGEVSFHLHMPE